MKNTTNKKVEIVDSPDLTDIYFSTSKRFYKTRRLKKRYSNLYNCEELYWYGALAKNRVLTIKTKDGQTFPKFLNYGYGITFEGLAKDLFVVNNAYTVKDGDKTYNYINEKSEIVFVGKRQKYTFCVRVYGEDENSHDRWVVVSVEE